MVKSQRRVRSKHENEELVKQLTSPSKIHASRSLVKQSLPLPGLDCFHRGDDFTFRCSKGLATFFVNKVSLVEFLFSGDWSPSEGNRALPMILGSFVVTLLSALVATPFAIGAAIFMTEISPKGANSYNPLLNFGRIPSVVYGFIGLQVVVPFVRLIFGGTGFGILSGTFVLFVMILPT